jgi:hypothetical protein
MFSLDERVAAPRDRTARRRFCHTDSHGRPQFSDPDGRLARVRGPVTPPPPYAPGSLQFHRPEPGRTPPSSAPGGVYPSNTYQRGYMHDDARLSKPGNQAKKVLTLSHRGDNLISANQEGYCTVRQECARLSFPASI